jgi:hypothetical protein
MAICFSILCSFAQETLKFEDLVQHLNVKSWIYSGKQLPKHCLVQIVEVRNGEVAGVYLRSAYLHEVERMVIMLDNNNSDQKVRVSVKVEGKDCLTPFCYTSGNTKKIDVSAYITKPFIVGKPIMLCGKIREVDGITNTNGDMKDFEEGLALLVTEEKKNQ